MSWRRLCGGLALAAAAGLAAAQAAPAAVTADYFGLVMSRADPAQPWPDVPFGSWRLWDAYVNWNHLEPARGQWQFDTLDRLVTEAQTRGVNALLVLAHSPAWASARPAEPSAFRPGVAAEPADIEDWRRYVQTVGQRYKGRLFEYQVWNEPSDKAHFSGSVDKLVELTCEARRELQRIDPRIKVVSGGSAGGGRNVEYLDAFLARGGAACIDVVAHHLYVPRFGPEAIVPVIRDVRAVMRKRGVDHLPLWNTESGWWIGNTDGTPEPGSQTRGWRRLDPGLEAGSYIQRSLLLARAEGVDRFYWYAWTNRIWGLADSQGKAKPALRYWSDIAATMTGATVDRCGARGAAMVCTLTRGQRSTELGWRDDEAGVPRVGPAARPASPATLPR